MTRTSAGSDRYVAGEWDVVYQTRRPLSARPIIFCHGSGQTATNLYDNTVARNLLDQLARYGTVIAADLGGQTWGNDTGQLRVGQALAYLNASHGTSGDAILVTLSMGNANGMGYALDHPENIAAIAAMSPLLDLDSLPTDYDDDLAAAYPPAYDDSTDGPTHSPIQYAADLDADMPVGIWTAVADPLALYDRAEAFVAARPQTVLTTVPGAHDDTAFNASFAGVLAFVADHI